jgi:hypothetical protein
MVIQRADALGYGAAETTNIGHVGAHSLILVRELFVRNTPGGGGCPWPAVGGFFDCASRNRAALMGGPLLGQLPVTRA